MCLKILKTVRSHQFSDIILRLLNAQMSREKTDTSAPLVLRVRFPFCFLLLVLLLLFWILRA